MPFLLAACLLLAFPLHVSASINIPPLPTKEKNSDKKKEPPLAPMAVPVTVEVSCGGTVQIPLRIYGRQEQTTSFLIRKEPLLGKIVSLQPVAQEFSILTYRHTAAMNGEPKQQDRILYVAQNKNGTSSSAEITIIITDSPPELAAPTAIDFGEIPAGFPTTRLVTIANTGGGSLEGSATAEVPWTLEHSSYKLRRGEQTQLHLTFTPDAEREYRGHLHFSGEPPVEIPLHASAYAPFTVVPDTLELAARSGSFTLTNRTDAELTLQVEANPRLHLPDQIVLPPKGSQSIPASLGSDDPAGIDGDIRISFSNVSRRIHIRAEAIAEATPTPTPVPAPTAIPAPAITPVPHPPVAASTSTPAPIMAPAHPEITPDVDPEALNSTLLNSLGKPSNLPTIQNIAVLRATAKGLAEFAWDPPKIPENSGNLTYQVEIRRLYFDPAGKLAQRWIPIPGIQYTTKPGRITALITGIPAGISETARIVALNANGAPCAQSFPFPFSTPPPLRLLTLRNGLLAGFLLMLLASGVLKWLQKYRSS